MRIVDFDIHHIEIPFKVSFSHASATRKQTDSVLVVAKSANGFSGFGEGCPRPYVTGETWKSTEIFFQTFHDELKKIQTYHDLSLWVSSHEKDIDENPAGWCAIEIAILDLLGKEQKQTIEEILELPRISGEFTYSAVIGTRNMLVFYLQALRYRLKGFSEYKVKISGRLREDRRKIKFLRIIVGKRAALRLDTNNLWTHTDSAIAYLQSLHHSFYALEEPVAVNQYQLLKDISSRLDVSMILDESFLRFNQFREISTIPARWIINVRISKMGGLIRSIKICEEAQKRKIPIIIGAQVGETSILTRSALSVANAFRDILVGQEGAFGTYLLQKDITKPSIQFGREGIVTSKMLQGKEKYGLGLLVKVPS